MTFFMVDVPLQAQKTPLQKSAAALVSETNPIGARRHAAASGPCTPFPTECRVLRVYIAKITFTTLIDHFTSLDAESSLVLSDQLIKLELLTQSIRQQKLPPHMRAVCGIRPGCPYGLGRRAGHGGGRILLRKDSEDHSN